MNDTEFLNLTELDNYLSGNVTVEPVNGFFQKLEGIIIYVTLVLIMFTMGSGISISDLKAHLKRPVGIAIGATCQFILMPFLAFVTIHLVGISGPYATGILLSFCSPGGAVSNILTYYADGDITLSVAMTTVSCVFALFAMPANLWLYGRYIDTGEAVIPYGSIALSLAAVLPPAAVGYLVKRKKPQYESCIVRNGSVFCLFMLLVIVGMASYDKATMFITAPGSVYLSVCALPLIALSMSYVVAWIFKRPPAIRRTVAIETSCQNVALAVTVAKLSFPTEVATPVIIFPCLYAATMISSIGILILIYRIYLRLCISDSFKSPLNEEGDTSEKFNSEASCVLANVRLSAF